jgi:hypothetical protein
MSSRNWLTAVAQEIASSSRFSHPVALLEAAAWKELQVTPPTWATRSTSDAGVELERVGVGNRSDEAARRPRQLEDLKKKSCSSGQIPDRLACRMWESPPSDTTGDT